MMDIILNCSLNNQAKSFLWTMASILTFVLGTGLWCMIGMTVTVAGTKALALLGILAVSSASGIGILVAYCVQKAQEAQSCDH